MTDTVPAAGSSILHKVELYVAGVAFVVMLAVIVLNVGLRYLFSSGILSSEEIAYLGFTWSTFAAVAWLYRSRGLIAVDIFFDILPATLQRFLAPVVDAVLLIANLWFCWLSWVLASGGWIRRTPVLEIPYFWVNLAPLLAFALMSAYSGAHLVRTLKRGPEPDVPRETAL